MANLDSRGWYISEIKSMGHTKWGGVQINKMKTHEIIKIYRSLKQEV